MKIVEEHTYVLTLTHQEACCLGYLVRLQPSKETSEISDLRRELINELPTLPASSPIFGPQPRLQPNPAPNPKAIRAEDPF